MLLANGQRYCYEGGIISIPYNFWKGMNRMIKGFMIYLLLGIISRAVFFVYIKPLPFLVELFAHALDVLGWPFATIASFYLLDKRKRRK